MSIEDNLIKFEGMDPAKFRQFMVDVEKFLGGLARLASEGYALIHEFNAAQRAWR